MQGDSGSASLCEEAFGALDGLPKEREDKIGGNRAEL